MNISAVAGSGKTTTLLELLNYVPKDKNTLFLAFNNAIVDEATTALVMLGFSKAAIAKVMPALLKENPNPRVEDLIKAALKKL